MGSMWIWIALGAAALALVVWRGTLGAKRAADTGDANVTIDAGSDSDGSD